MSDYYAMLDPTFISEVKRFLAWFLPSVLGVSTKLAYESRIKKITRPRVVTSLIMAMFVGYMCDVLCTKYDLIDIRGVVVSLSALASETIVQYILSNSNRGLNAFFKRVFNVDFNKNSDGSEIEEKSNKSKES